MAIWLTGWAGDNAGEVVGRKPSTLLIGVSHAEKGDAALSALWTSVEVDGVTVFPDIFVRCLTPGARRPIITDVESMGAGAYALRVIQSDTGAVGKPWETGVHLFAVSLWQPYTTHYGYASGTALATAVIRKEKAELLDLTRVEVALQWIAAMDRVYEERFRAVLPSVEEGLPERP